MTYKQIRRRTQQNLTQPVEATAEVSQTHEVAEIQTDRDLMTADDTLALQEVVGNRATGQIIGEVANRRMGEETPPRPLPNSPIRTGYIQPKPIPPQPLRPGGSPHAPAYAHLQRKPTLQRASWDGSFDTNADFENQVHQQSGGGKPLPSDVRADLEPKFGADFSGVKVHTDAKAAQLSQDVGAQAFTHGSDIYFNQGKYDPNSGSGKHLLAHELTHTVQQGAAGVQRSLAKTNQIQRRGPTDWWRNRQEQQELTAQSNREALNKIRSDILTPLENKDWLKAHYSYQDMGLAYQSAGFFGSMSLTKYIRGVSELNTSRTQAKNITTPNDEKDLPKMYQTISDIAKTSQQQADPTHFSRDNLPHAINMTSKISHYLLQAIPKSAIEGQIVAETIGNTSIVEENSTPTAILMMGGPGSGKSTIIDEVVEDKSSFVIADPDAVKAALPEYRAGVKAGNKDIATKVHQQSKDVAQNIVRQTIARRSNLLFDGTGGDLASYRSMAQQLKRANYEVNLVMAHVTVDEGLKRVKQRAEETGRSVPDKVVKDIYSWVPANFVDMLPLSNYAVVFDNLGKDPQKIWETADGPNIKAEHVRTLKSLIGLSTPVEFQGDEEQEEYIRQVEEQEFKYLTSSGFNYTKKLKDDLLGTRGKSEEDQQRAHNLLKKYNLSFAEAAAIGIYTADDYKYMNPALANNEGWMKSMLPRTGFKNLNMAREVMKGVTSTHVEEAKEEGLVHSKMALQGLAKLPNWTGHSYRGVAFTPEEFSQKYQEGGTVTMEAFTSTSLNESESRGYARKEAKQSREVRGGAKEAYLLDLNLTHGKDIQDFSNTKKEAEVLVLPGAEFTVDEIKVESEETFKVNVKEKLEDKSGTDEEQKLTLSRVIMKQTR